MKQSTESQSQAPSSSTLRGLDGTNPLGFVAAIGLFRVLSSDSDLGEVSLRWVPSAGTWVPDVACTVRDLTEDQLLEVLQRNLNVEMVDHPLHRLESLASRDGEERRAAISEMVTRATCTDRLQTDWLSAYTSDAAGDDAINQLQTTRRDYHYRNAASIIAVSNLDYLRRAIFHEWDYADALDNQSLHLDPSEDRRHAYQWNKPSGDPERKRTGGMLGANRLAIEGLPVFTSVPVGDRLRTTGFTGSRATDTRWTWPIWSGYLDLGATRSLLSCADLQADDFDPLNRQGLRERGILAVYRTYRILVGKTPNFTPVRQVA
jgi:CRISPR-associated endonuclease/helicase Cas3